MYSVKHIKIEYADIFNYSIKYIRIEYADIFNFLNNIVFIILNVAYLLTALKVSLSSFHWQRLSTNEEKMQANIIE